MKSEQEVPVSIEIYDKEGREFLSKTISVNGEWKNTVLIFDPLQLLTQEQWKSA